MFRTLYDILGVRPNASFSELKAAYYARAKQCHPDMNGGSQEATEEFQRLVNAFDILSDPVTRQKYDEQRAMIDNPLPDANGFHVAGDHIMDSIADDILEELVVGNNLSPTATTLQNLMLDLVKTSHFIMFREAKNAYLAGRYSVCRSLCSKLVDLSPQNILYHYYLAEAARHVGHEIQALRHYRRCLAIGAQRMPPQHLHRVHRHYKRLLERQGVLGRLLAWFAGEPPAVYVSEEERMRQGMDAFFSKALKKKHNHPSLTAKPERKLIKK